MEREPTEEEKEAQRRQEDELYQQFKAQQAMKGRKPIRER